MKPYVQELYTSYYSGREIRVYPTVDGKFKAEVVSEFSYNGYGETPEEAVKQCINDLERSRR